MTEFNESYKETYAFSATCAQLLLEASTALPYTVPGTPDLTYRAHFSVSTSADVWVCWNGTAALPISNTVSTTSYQERIDVGFQRFVRGGDTLSFISTGAIPVGVSFLKLPRYS